VAYGHQTFRFCSISANPRAKTMIALTGQKPSHTTRPLWVFAKHNFSSIAVVAAKYYFTAERKKSFV
jgi:hypothetical protein